MPQHTCFCICENNLFLHIRKTTCFCICENKDAHQLRGNREADQCLCFRYTDSTISLLPKSKILSLQPSSVAVQPGLCRTWSETLKTGFVVTQHICFPGNCSLPCHNNGTCDGDNNKCLCLEGFTGAQCEETSK